MDDDIAGDARLYRGWEIEILAEPRAGHVSVHARLKHAGQPTVLIARRIHGPAVTDEMLQAVMAEVRQRIDAIESRW